MKHTSKRAASAVLSMIPPALTIATRAANANAVKVEVDLISGYTVGAVSGTE